METTPAETVPSYHLLTDNSVSIYHDGNFKTVFRDDTRFSTVKLLATEGKYEAALKAADVEAHIKEQFESSECSEYRLEDGVVYFRNKRLRAELNEHVVRMVIQNHDMTVMTRFLERLVNNPSSRVQEQLYSFMQANNCPMLADGRIMLFKRIRHDWTDCHSGKIDNSIGKVISVARSEVDDDPNRTCSHGLHVCSIEYLSHFYGDRLVGVAVDPADVVAIPYDYNNSKVRVCRYEVVNELPLEICQSQRTPWNSAVVDDDGYDPDDLMVEDADEYPEDDEEIAEEPLRSKPLMDRLRAWVRG